METSREFIGEVTEGRAEAIFIDGSRYRGTWDSLGIGGAGSFRMPHDVIFEGEIKDGMNHGQGTIIYPGKQMIDGVWNRGEMKKWRYTFDDGLVYENEGEGWSYCQFPDRRFNRSKVSGLRPAGRSLKTEDQPTKVIPHGCYDTGDGIFDPNTFCVNSFDHPSKVVRIPSADERRWITKHCRKGGTEPTGYQPWLNENWSSDPPDLPYRLPMSKDSPESWWKRIFTFERDESVILAERRRSLFIETSTETEESTETSDDGISESVCGPDGESRTYEGTELRDICGGDSNSEKIISEMNIVREVVCEEIESLSDEYEDSEDLLMTVCRPPEGSYTITRRRTLTMTRQSEDHSSEGEDEGEEYAGEAEEEEEEELGISWEKKIGEEVNEEEEEGGHRAVLWDEEEEEWEEIREGIDDSTGLTSKEMNESIIGEDYSISDMKMVRGSRDLKKLDSKRKKRKSRGRGKKVKRTKRSTSKKDKKHPCPPVIDKDQILQREVGDLLFSPALDAPRSPVHLVRKTCDRKRCEKLKIAKFHKRVATKCGGTSSAFNSPAGHRGRSMPRVCNTGSSIKNKICSYPKLFVTVPRREKS